MEHDLVVLVRRVEGVGSRGVSLDIQLGSVLGEALQADLLADQGEELLKGRAGLLVVVHLLLRALASLTVKDAHFVFPAEPLLVELQELLRHLGSVESQPQAVDVELGDDVL